MTIQNVLNENTLTIAVEGRLDSVTAPDLDAEIKNYINDLDTLIFDFIELEYISSAGLRVLLSAQKIMDKNGSMIIRNANETVLEIFDVTGFTEILNIE